MKKSGLICLLVILFFGHYCYSQPEHRHSIAFAAGAVYLSDDKVVDPGVHLEYAYHFMLGKILLNSGSSIEMIFGEERHIGLALYMGYSPLKGWDVGLGPGVMFEGDTHYYCINISTSYGFDMGSFSLGPAMELAHTGKHFHFLMGLHIELDF